jgi:hypothetical protein
VQLIEFLVRQILYRVRQVLGKAMPTRRRRIGERCGTRRGRPGRRGEQIRRNLWMLFLFMADLAVPTPRLQGLMDRFPQGLGSSPYN